MTRKELLAISKREWDEVLHGVTGVWVVPNRRKHESGWECMDFVASFKDKEKKLVRFGGYCDDVQLKGGSFRMDCDYPSGIIHIWSYYPFTITSDLSTIKFIEEDYEEEK